ncbi:vacuolar ATPase assembly integral membrane protein VMA21-like isoform X2 [Haliotis asinina]|uniref:vacuolar ATPase assembly integral membrane protein VMA21-like isoform X2 n=1 Tax=Haliotis asinina TaxID=109174 RepID=UPI003531ED8D
MMAASIRMADNSNSKVMKTMIMFSIGMITCPIFSYFFSKSFIFEGVFGMPHESSYFYSAIVSIVVVHIILFMFIYVAWTEDAKPQPPFKIE